MSRERGAWARWQEIMRLVKGRGGVGFLEPPNWQETIHFGISVLEAKKGGKGGNLVSECNLLLIMLSLQ